MAYPFACILNSSLVGSWLELGVGSSRRACDHRQNCRAFDLAADTWDHRTSFVAPHGSCVANLDASSLELASVDQDLDSRFGRAEDRRDLGRANTSCRADPAWSCKDHSNAGRPSWEPSAGRVGRASC